MLMTKNPTSQYLAFAGIALVIGAGSFIGGTAYQKGKDGPTKAATTQAPSFRGQAGTNQGQGAPSGGFGGRRGGGGGLTIGQVTAVNGTSITIQTFQGADETVDLSSSTAITKTVSGSVSDVAAGESVTVSGTAGSDGAIQATSVQIRPDTGGGTQGAL